MVSGPAKTKSNKTFFDEAPPLLGFYYPSPQKCLGKNLKKIAIRAEEKDSDDLHADYEGFATIQSDSASSITFDESWPSTEYHEYDAPLNRVEHVHHKFVDREFLSPIVVKNKSLHHQDMPAADSGSAEQDSMWDSVRLGRSQNQIFASQRSTYKETIQVQERADKVLKSAKTLLSSGNATKYKCPTKEGFDTEADGLQGNSSLDYSSLLNSDNDVVSDWRKDHWLKEKKPSIDTVLISEGQVGRNADDTSVVSSDFPVSTEGLGRSSGTNESSEEMFHPSFVNIQDTNGNKLINHYGTDLPFSQYWKSNLNEDILYQWRIKRRIQLAREQAKSEKQGFVPRSFSQQQVMSQVRCSPNISSTVLEDRLQQDVSLQVPWYSQVQDIQISQQPKKEVSTQPQRIPETYFPRSTQAATSSKPSVIPDNQFSFLRSTALNIQTPTITNYQEPHYLHHQNSLEADYLGVIERSSHCPKNFSSQNEKVNAGVQTSLEDYETSGSLSLVSPYNDHSDSHNSQGSACDILPCKHPPNNTENQAIPPASISGSDQFSNGKTTKYHKYLVAEKPHCSKLDSNIPPSLLEKKNENSKTQKRKSLKSDQFHGQRSRVNRRMENKTVKTYFKHTNKMDSCPPQGYHQTYLPEESTESSSELTDDPQLLIDAQSSSDEEFSSDLMLQHLRKQRSTFKEQLRFIDEKLKILSSSEKD